MEIEVIQRVIRKVDYSLTDSEVELWARQCIDSIETGSIDFSKYNKNIFTQGKKKRIVYSYDSRSVENYVCHYLKRELDKAFKIRYASRSKITNLLFNTLSAVKDMNDFVIVRADFKSFFDCVLSEYIYTKYILPSLLTRGDKDILERYVAEFKYCYAGLCLSNGMTEIVCRDFDKIIRAKLSTYGMFFYERYVDDMLFITNRFVTEADVKKIINEAIRESFGNCPVRLSDSTGKFSYISRRNLTSSQHFNFLGYEYTIDNAGNKITLKYGITEKKRNRYKNIAERAFIDYKGNNNLELLRQRIKVFSSRVVVARQLVGTNFDWLTKGVVANYNELKNYCDCLDSETTQFLEDVFYELMKTHNLKRPYFIPKNRNEDSIYSLISNMKRNRTILFEEKIGVPKDTLVRWIKKISPSYSDYGKDYYRIVIDYFEIIKIK